MKIGFLTTINTNCGDDFVREGIRAVLDGICEYQPFYVNKHDALSISVPVEDETELLPDKYQLCDVFIQAGAPVYWHLYGGGSTSLNVPWYRWMWEQRILNGGPRFLNIGAGSCQPWGDDGSSFTNDENCAKFARKVAGRSRLTTVRDPIASDMLLRLGIEHHYLPCPAFLAAARYKFAESFGGPIGVNLMPIGGHEACDPTFDKEHWLNDCAELVNRLRALGSVLFLAHNLTEETFAERFAVAGERVFRSTDWRAYLSAYAGCKLVVANRVHGAILAAGFGIPSIIIGNDSRATIGDKIGIFRFHAGHCTPREISDSACRLLCNAHYEHARLIALRSASVCKYTKLLELAIA